MAIGTTALAERVAVERSGAPTRSSSVRTRSQAARQASPTEAAINAMRLYFTGGLEALVGFQAAWRLGLQGLWELGTVLQDRVD